MQGLLFFYSAKGFAGYSVWKSLGDDFKLETGLGFLQGDVLALKQKTFFPLFFNSTPQTVKLPESAASFCDRLSLDLCFTRGNLWGWMAQLQWGISSSRLINNSPEKQTGIDFKGYTFIEKRQEKEGLEMQEPHSGSVAQDTRHRKLFHLFRCISIPIESMSLFMWHNSDLICRVVR